MDRGPDVSSYQGQVDWQAVKQSGCTFGICKATEGTTYTAPTFRKNWEQIDAVGLSRGCYHFARPDASGAKAQAEKFLATVATWKPADLLVLDIEDGTGNLSAWALDWLATVYAATGIVPWLYSYAPFIRAHLTASALAAYPLWLAAYQPQPPTCPAPWKTYGLWQHTDKAQIPGIKGGCDESVGTLPDPAPPAVEAPDRTQTVPIPVHDFEELAVKQTMVHIGPLDKDGNGWADWQPGLGRDPNIVAVVQLGPSPPDDNGYWPGQAKVNLSAQPRGGVARVVVRNGTPGDTVTAFVTVS
jgi:hypothetical protein